MRNRLSGSLLAVVGAATLAFAVTPAGAASPRWESIETVAGHAPVTVMVKDNARIYFRVTRKAPIVVPVDGPAVLRVVSRVELATGSGEAVSYRLTAIENGKEIDRAETESSVADRARIASGTAAIGKSRRWTIDIPRGRHAISIHLDGTESALLRLQRGSARGAAEAPMVTLTPVDAPRSVSVSEGEKTIPYFTTFAGRPVRFRVVGPVTVQFTTRLDFDPSMRGTQNYAVRVREGTRTLRDFAFKTTKAVAAVYSNLPDRVPSKYDRARVDVPAGTHEILLELVRPVGGAAEVHGAIPEPVTGGEE